MMLNRFRANQRVATVLKRFGSDKNELERHWVDDFRQYFQMKGLMIKSAMTKIKMIEFDLPLLNMRNVVIPYSLSDLAGHGSFMLLALSYLESDFLNLRAYAFSGITLSILFQYYREKPLWIPIRWNSLFLLINAVMILLLLKDETDANNIPEEQKFLYTSVFQSKGMKPVDYLHLISSAKRFEFKKGQKLVAESRKNTRVCLVKKGKLVVMRGGEKIGTINQYQFVGAMSFLTWVSGVDALDSSHKEHHKPLRPSVSNEAKAAYDTATGNAINHSTILSAPVPTTTDGAASAFLNTATTSGADDSTVAEGVDGGAVSSTVEGQSGWADVICEEDCVVFSWDFRELHELVKANPTMGMVLERCISEDLNRKMANSWQDEPKNRYKQLLTGALMDGEVTPNKKALLEKSRGELHISPQDHLLILDGLGWSKEDFETGYKGAPPQDVMAKYTRLLKRCMVSEEGITEDDRTSLRKFRNSSGISTLMHVSLLRQLGWTTDEYETGVQNETSTATPPAVNIPLSPPPSSPPTSPSRFLYSRRLYNWLTAPSGSSQSTNAPAVSITTTSQPAVSSPSVSSEQS